MKKPIGQTKIRLATNRQESNPFTQQQILSEHITGKYSRLERRFLAGIFENAHHCIRPTNIKYDQSGYRYRPKSLYLASISLSLRYVKNRDNLSHYEFVDNTPYRHLTYSDNTSIKKFEETVLGCIENCADKLDEERERDPGPLIISLNEFGFPFYRQDDLRTSFLQKLDSYSEKKNAYILCGSSHCFRTKQNVAILSHPGKEGIIEHPKFSPAINLGEQLRPRTSLNWDYYSMDIGRVGILICFDVVDPNVLLRQIYFARDMQASNRINLFLIPTFSANDFVRDQAELLSYLTKSVVMYTNHQYADPQDLDNLPKPGSSRKRSHGLFIGGEDVTWNKDVASPYLDLCENISPITYLNDEKDDGHWGSINMHKLAYRDIIQTLSTKSDEFSPLLKEILSLAKPDPTMAGR